LAYNTYEADKLEKNNFLIGYYGFWVILTYLNAIAGLFGIFFAMGGHIRYALMCLMISGLCDGLDGRVANLKERTDRQKGYGIQVDSFADIISFGILPVFLGGSIIQKYFTAEIFITFYLIISVIYILAAIIRLAYFNVIETEHLNKKERRNFFEGLPVTSVAIIIPVFYSICCIFNFSLSYVYMVMLLFYQ